MRLGFLRRRLKPEKTVFSGDYYEVQSEEICSKTVKKTSYNRYIQHHDFRFSSVELKADVEELKQLLEHQSLQARMLEVANHRRKSVSMLECRPATDH